MVVRRLKVVLTILSEKSRTFTEGSGDHGVPESLFLLSQEEFFKDVNLEVLKKGVDDLLNLKKELSKRPEEKYAQLIHKVVLVIFSNTTPKERQFYFNELLEHFYAAMNENILMASDSSSLISKREYQRLIRQCIPLVKLEIVRQQLEKYDPGETKQAAALKIAIEELYECICFPRILREECYEIATKKLGSKNYNLQKFELHDMDEREGNLGMYAKLKIIVEHEGKPVSLHIFAKFLLEEGERLRTMSESTFKKEQFMYTVFIPLLKQMDLGSLVDFSPECYLVRADEVIFMEDLSVQGYSTSDVGKPFDLDQILKVVKRLAKLHAASLLLEEKVTDSIGNVVTIDEYYGEYLVDMFYVLGDLKSLVNDFINYFLKRFPEMAKKVSAEIIKERVKGQLDKWFEAMKKSEKYRNVLCHGDTWCNNILFQHIEGEKTDNCYLVDYQLSRYCPPAVEVLCFLYNTTDKKTRSEHMTSILQVYYTELKKHLRDYGMDIEKICPSDTFMECCENVRLAALFHSLIYLHYILIPKDKMKELREDGEKMKKLMAGDRALLFEEFWYHLPFRTRLSGNIQEICELCENM